MDDSTVPVKPKYKPGDEICKLNEQLYDMAKEARDAGDTKQALEVYQTIIKAMDVAVKWIGPRTPAKNKVEDKSQAGKLLKPEHRERITKVIQDTQREDSGILLDADLWEADGTPKFGRA